MLPVTYAYLKLILHNVYWIVYDTTMTKLYSTYDINAKTLFFSWIILFPSSYGYANVKINSSHGFGTNQYHARAW